jgi:hypothetical protein
MSSKLKIVDGFVWLIVTEEAREIFMSGLFDLYILHDDGSESKVEGYTQLQLALANGLSIAIQGGHLPTSETQADLQREVVEKSGINIVSCGMCAEVILHRISDDEILCPHCEFNQDPCHFPDLYY